MNLTKDVLRVSAAMGFIAALSVLTVLTASTVTTAAENVEALTIRVNDAIGLPGGMVAVVLRTYASRPIGQGQLCYSVKSPNPNERPTSRPADAIDSSMVYGANPDVSSVHTALFEQDPQIFLIEFNSPSASINAEDGPMAVFLIQLTDDVIPGQLFDLELDLANSSLTDENGLAILIEPRNGQLEIRSPLAPFDVSADAEGTAPGGIAALSFSTAEVLPLSRGRVGFRYDPSIAAGPPTVAMDPRYGAALFSVEHDAGLVVVTFESPDYTLNTIPGNLVQVWLPTRPSIPSGTTSLVWLDPALTFVEDAAGTPLTLSIEDDVLEFDDPTIVSLGTTANLSMGRLPDDFLHLRWDQDCGSGAGFAVYRGDLTSGYSSLALEPGFCSVLSPSAAVPLGPGEADFFLVVPIGNALEGSYGTDSFGVPRTPASTVCYPQGELAACAPAP